ncbi:MAG: hypothetical protein Q7J03_04150 [Methanoregula sp.]|nr:hypothetical protein [Methanoregula sp.]
MAVYPVIPTLPVRENILPERTHSSLVQFRHLSFLVRILVLALVSIAVLSGGALANPPSDVTMTYDQNAGDLIVTVVHPVDDPTTHYVKQVTVMQGDTVLVDKSYTNQPDKSSFTYRYNLPQLKESSGGIRVNAQCILFGSRSGTLTPSAVSSPVTPGNEIPAAPAPTKSPVCAFVALVAVGIVARQVLK